MSAEDYARYPVFIVMREVEVNGRMLVTTLHNPHGVSTRALDALYKMRSTSICSVDLMVRKSTSILQRIL